MVHHKQGGSRTLQRFVSVEPNAGRLAPDGQTWPRVNRNLLLTPHYGRRGRRGLGANGFEGIEKGEGLEEGKGRDLTHTQRTGNTGNAEREEGGKLVGGDGDGGGS